MELMFKHQLFSIAFFCGMIRLDLEENVMNLSRNDSRVLAMVILYQVDLFDKRNISYVLDDLIDNNTLNIQKDISFIKKLVMGVIEHKKELEDIANKYLRNWNISRLGLTDGAILKIAIYELLYTDTPKKVCIDEAIELSKDFSDEKVVGMINGVLDKVYHEQLEKDNDAE